MLGGFAVQVPRAKERLCVGSVASGQGMLALGPKRFTGFCMHRFWVLETGSTSKKQMGFGLGY